MIVLKELLVFVLILSCVLASTALNQEAETMISVINSRRGMEPPTTPEERNAWLDGAMKTHNRRLIEFIVTELYRDASEFSDEVLERAAKADPRKLIKDPTIVKHIRLDFTDDEALKTALFTANTFFSQGHLVRVFIGGFRNLDLEKIKSTLLDLIARGQMDLNKEMFNAIQVGRMDFVMFFIQNGARLDAYNLPGAKASELLLLAILSRKCNADCVEMLLQHGASLDPKLHLLRTVLKAKDFGIAKVLIKHKLEEENFWKLLVESKQTDLLLEALRNGYEISLAERELVLESLLSAHEFEASAAFLSFDSSNDSGKVKMAIENIWKQTCSLNDLNENKVKSFDGFVQKLKDLAQKHGITLPEVTK